VDATQRLIREGFVDVLDEEVGEGCRIYGYLEVAKLPDK
jgi:hypothetical protein